ncbi:MAG: hypothetical protein HP025_05940 [Angelakisella sp.]|uniref:hypothetical protein n=1 Tax=Angelakisella sp. TaxID=1935177 RepID=UPI003FEF2D93|nr:hypothetical protein [Angelakisella sp.]
MNRPAEDRNNDLTGCWERFWHSGRVEDYLAYRAAQAAAPKEPTDADSDRRSGAAGTQAG